SRTSQTSPLRPCDESDDKSPPLSERLISLRPPVPDSRENSTLIRIRRRFGASRLKEFDNPRPDPGQLFDRLVRSSIGVSSSARSCVAVPVQGSGTFLIASTIGVSRGNSFAVVRLAL